MFDGHLIGGTSIQLPNLNNAGRGTMLGHEMGFSMEQELSFMESCLPRTMELANRNKPLISSSMEMQPNDWSFGDRVLVWLAEHWKDDVEKYRSSGRGSMAEQFNSFQLEHLDEHYESKLRSKIE